MRSNITKRTMKFFKRIRDAFSLRRLEESLHSTQSLKDQFHYMFVRAMFFEVALGLVEREIYLLKKQPLWRKNAQ